MFNTVKQRFMYFNYFFFSITPIFLIVLFAFVKGGMSKGMFVFESGIFFFVVVLNLFLLRNKVEFYETYFRYPRKFGIFQCIPIGSEFIYKKSRKQLTPWRYVFYGNISKIERVGLKTKLIYSGNNASFVDLGDVSESDFAKIEEYYK